MYLPVDRFHNVLTGELRPRQKKLILNYITNLYINIKYYIYVCIFVYITKCIKLEMKFNNIESYHRLY